MLSVLARHLSPALFRPNFLYSSLRYVSTANAVTNANASSSPTTTDSAEPPPLDPNWHILSERAKLTADERWRKRSENTLKALLPPGDAYAGRSVPVTDGKVLEAYVKLQARLGRNNVFQEAKFTKRHEKRGVKRRRLSSERWRRRFADEVRKKVQLVSTIRHRGA